ncbi:hypothetical protein [Helicobacter sp. T3_23-1056]
MKRIIHIFGDIVLFGNIGFAIYHFIVGDIFVGLGTLIGGIFTAGLIYYFMRFFS